MTTSPICPSFDRLRMRFYWSAEGVIRDLILSLSKDEAAQHDSTGARA